MTERRMCGECNQPYPIHALTCSRARHPSYRGKPKRSLGERVGDLIGDIIDGVLDVWSSD